MDNPICGTSGEIVDVSVAIADGGGDDESEDEDLQYRHQATRLSDDDGPAWTPVDPSGLGVVDVDEDYDENAMEEFTQELEYHHSHNMHNQTGEYMPEGQN